MKTAGLERRFAAALRGFGVGPAARVLAAVSGGGDSMALLHLLRGALGSERLVVAHMDHGLRASSARDGHFVASVCAELGVRLVAEVRPVARLRRRGESLEAAGRRLRYEFFEDVRERTGCGWIALGHTSGDVAESVLLNLARGTGLRGLAGIPPRRGRVIRPLLDFSREELREWLLARGLAWVEDESNDSPLFARNRARHVVLPCLEEQLNPRAARHLADLAAEALAWREEQERICAALWRDAAVSGGTWPALNMARLRKMSAWERGELLRFAGRFLELSTLPRGRLLELERLIAANGRWVFQWGSEVDLTACGGVLTFHPAAEKRRPVVALVPGMAARWGGWRVSLTAAADGGPVCEAADGDVFSALVPVEPGRRVVLMKSGAAFNDPFPAVCAEGAGGRRGECGAFARGRGAAAADGGAGVRRVSLTPLVGKWRKSEWNSSLRTSS